MRCWALAQALQARGATVHFLGLCESEALRNRITASGFAFAPVRAPHPDPTDLATVRSLAREGDWLVLDGYHFDTAYQRQAQAAGLRLLVVDDNAHLPAYAATVLLNQNPEADQLPYEMAPEAVFLAGARYSLLRSEFAPWRDARPAPPLVAQRFLITMGGADPENATLVALKGLEQARIAGAEAVVILGPANQHGDVLAAEAAELDLPIRFIRSPENMAELLTQADLAISAAGGTCWELAFLGVPSLLLVIAENQRQNAAWMAEAGAAVVADLTPTAIAGALQALSRDQAKRMALAERARQLVDGRGPSRVAEVMWALSRTGTPPGEWRPAEEGDALAIWRLANDPQVRANSYSQAPIPLADHLRWFGRKVAAPETRYWVYDVAGVVAAQVRYDRVSKAEAEIHFAVAPAFRGRGLGTEALRTWRRACSELGVSAIYGLVLTENLASARAFRSAGYAEDGMVEQHGRRSFRFRRTLDEGAAHDQQQPDH